MVEGDEDPLAAVSPGERAHFRYPVGESYLGDPVSVPVTIINGAHEGPSLFLTAGIHGDELNGVKVIQEIAAGYDPADIHGRIVCLHVCNVPAFEAQQRYTPIYDQDMNRAFPGKAQSTKTERMANRLYSNLIEPCDLGIDFHTSTRHRTTIYHVRADLTQDGVERLARSFAANVVLFGAGDAGALRRVATENGIPAITVEMGRAHRFQPVLIEKALAGIESVLGEYGMLPNAPVHWPGWYETTSATSTKRWIRADVGGLVDMEWGPFPLVHDEEVICTISDHFSQRHHEVRAPFDALIVGALENPVVSTGHPLCHLLRLDDATREEIEREIHAGEFDGYRRHGDAWHDD